MKFERLRIHGLRCLTDVAVDLAEGIHVFVGPNGAGKTSVLEAAYLLSHGRSFRSGAREALLQRGLSSLAVFAETSGEGGVRHRLGLGREGARWEARLDGLEVPLGQLVQACAVVCFEPGSHALIAGAAEERRRFLDWGVFHVEHDFLAVWRRYQRALKQRNALLRSGGAPDELFLPWERELDEAGGAIDRFRQHYLDRLLPAVADSAADLLPELGSVALRYRRGWAEDTPLREVLAAQRGRDLARGHTTVGAHRADWSLAFEHAPLREHLSRGQEKLTALICLLAQATLHAECRGEWPIVCLDDLASELDQEHQAAVVERLGTVGAQVLITGTECPESLRTSPHRMFHVEQGQIRPLL
ncbi:DNA replication/repair protein RecF [Frateuria sp. STR12]|uniref:DNA replication/repair protein RecF n=1 Tax=Frateuria hangzhouensis TaxID=2995589 RepID=UPI002260EDE5|nr:DNA replication/repair protein RecF [Frateuria sp. STR12]MCX7513349.1 DNA replication/repair protein RecF [Frateuria sp. STR12]